MGLVVLFLFFLCMALAGVGVYIEKCIIMKSLSDFRGVKINAAYTSKRRFENLESYRVECESKGISIIWYKIERFIYEKLKYLMGLILFLGFANFLIA